MVFSQSCSRVHAAFVSLILTISAIVCGETSHTSSSKALQPVSFTDVKLKGGFWGPRQETNRTVSIPHSLEMLDRAGNIKDLELAATGARTGYEGPLYIDSDLYKAIEAVSYSLASTPDAALEKKLDEIIAKITAAQEPDGYLNTHFQVVEPDKKWNNLRDKHELYCAGHLIEAAVAHYQATGKRTLLDVAVRFADLIDSIFGDAPGKRMGYPGHEEIELALYKLGRVTGEDRYFKLANFFLDHRGTAFFAREHNTPPEKYDGKYWQDNVPLRDHSRIVGHAVRAVYLLSGATDYAAASRDDGLLNMLDRVWHNTTDANMYVTGGIGSSAKNEGFTFDYDLPNYTGYQETCASVAMILWNHRLALLSGERKYMDILEQTLYNGFLAGVSLDGTKFFYVNPLASHGNHHRKDWYGTACCPPNVTRTLAQLGGYAYAVSPETLWVNLYMQGALNTTVDGEDVTLDVTTDYPWDGSVRMNFAKSAGSSSQPLKLKLRVPGWCKAATVKLNGNVLAATPDIENGYFNLSRPWKENDELVLHFEMPVERVVSNPKVTANTGRAAIKRGPLVYCLEAADNSVPVDKIALPYTADLIPKREKNLLGDIVTISGLADSAADKGRVADSKLYASLDNMKQTTVTAIPYYSWDNRTSGAMVVWIPAIPETAQFQTLESKAKVSISFDSPNSDFNGARDGVEAHKSSDQPAANCHWWPHKGTSEWIQYQWDESQIISNSRVFWFDDTGRGECRVPVSWNLEYLDGQDNKWKRIERENYATERDRYNEVQFAPVKTTSLRLNVQMKSGFAAGVHEWQVGSR